jgi:hypothetical protein
LQTTPWGIHQRYFSNEDIRMRATWCGNRTRRVVKELPGGWLGG